MSESGKQLMGNLASLTREGTVGVITLNSPPDNVLDSAMAGDILRALETVAGDPSLVAVVLIGGGGTFSSGTDFQGLERAASGRKNPAPDLHPLMLALEDFPRPIVCAVHGSAAGPGLEMAMACHHRVALASASLSLPEVKFGLIPGAGGTQRLPRLVGIARAAEMCAFGDPINGAQAHECGIVDRVEKDDLLPIAVAFAMNIAAAIRKPRRTRDQIDRFGEPHASAKALAAIREQSQKKQRGRIAPLRAIDAVESAARLPFQDGCRLETRFYQECLASEQFKALFHASAAERGAASIPGIRADVPIKEIRSVGIVGAGTMGSGIAMIYANAGIPVVLKDVAQDAVARGMAVIQRNYASAAKKGRLSPAIAEQRLKLIRPAESYEDFSQVDIAIEAVFEELALKTRIVGELDKFCRPDTILASNTSTLDIDRIASATSFPGRVVGHHFFAPPLAMRLIEIVRGKETAADVIASSLALAARLGKIGVVVGNCRGFVGNRMYYQYQREAQFLIEEGALVQNVDTALFNFGMAMGPFATADLSGLDVGWRARREARPFELQGIRRPLVADRLYEMGRLGQKSGAGWYRYRPNDREPIPDPAVARCIEECAREAGISQRAVPPEEIVERTIFAAINEGAKILEEGIALRAADIDVIFINGYGFPAHRGGPMWFADTIGLERVYQRIREFEQQHGPLWTPAPLLRQLTEQGKSFYESSSQ